MNFNSFSCLIFDSKCFNISRSEYLTGGKMLQYSQAQNIPGANFFSTPKLYTASKKYLHISISCRLGEERLDDKFLVLLVAFIY